MAIKYSALAGDCSYGLLSFELDDTVIPAKPELTTVILPELLQEKAISVMAFAIKIALHKVFFSP